MLDIRRVIASKPRRPRNVELNELTTTWGEEILAGKRGVGECSHPRPRLARDSWASLNGWWECAFVECPDAASAWRDAPVPTNGWRRIRVPFSPEAPLSGVGRRLGAGELLWYRLRLEIGELSPEERCLLHFEAVDWACSVYVNGSRVGEHVGGYLPFSVDATPFLRRGENRVELCVYDPSDEGTQLRGKQRIARGGIWYTAQSGIWQDVWYEMVPAAHVTGLRADARPAEGRVDVLVSVEGEGKVWARVLDGGTEVSRGSARSYRGRCSISLPVEDPRLWSPDDPHLYDLELAFGDDRVSSYVGFRTVEVRADEKGVPRVFLNGEPIFLRGVLDQGYWPDGLMTAPAEEALEHDVRAARDLGFNMLRMHLKVESGRFYALCDRLGMLVWQDMVSGGGSYGALHTSYLPTLLRASWTRHDDEGPIAQRQLSSADEAYREEWLGTCEGTIRLLRDHPSVIGWTLFNEGWGQFAARSAVAAVRALDPTRPIDATSGWYDRGCGDILSAHNYFRPLEVWRDRASRRRAFVISEFGGVSWAVPGHVSLSSSYGYDAASGKDDFAREVGALLDKADALEGKGLAGFVYTQLSDVEEETNGLLTYDRRVTKLPVE